ncbi:MAG TPA: MFS transporter, partial [Corynebacterium falsenii]|nr:MFS transporter [Corynebacterium falsenii]
PVVWISLVALGCATFQLGLILIATRTRQAGAAAALSSGAQGIGYTVASVGPFVFGALFDATGSWTPGLVMLLVFNTVLFGAGLIAGRPVFVDDPR